MRGKPGITLPDEARTHAITSIRRYLTEELDLDVGELQADLLLRYFLEEIGPTVYNQAIIDARQFFEQRAADLDATCYHAEFPFWKE
jgi:uncharacterized protein (DUF2164 family)